MHKHGPHSIGRRGFLKGSLVTGALVGLGGGKALANARLAAASAGIRAKDWNSLPMNDGRTVNSVPEDLGGDLQLPRASTGSFASSHTFVSEVQWSSTPYNMVGMHWVASVPEGTSLEVEVRGSVDGNTWGEWLPVGHLLEARGEEELRSDETFSDAVELGRAHAMQYRLTLETTDAWLTPVVRRVTATQIDSLSSPRLEDLDARGQSIPFRVGNGGPPSARLILRDGPGGWGPGYIAPDSDLYWEPYAGLYKVQFVTIHHTAWANNPENPVATMRAVWYYHAITLGWGDIGYHFMVDQYGNVYQGRDGGDSTEGGHVSRYNHYNLGICLMGQFEPGAPNVPPGGKPTAEALDSAMRMAALACAYHGLNPMEQGVYPKPTGSCRPQLTNFRISGHRDWGRGTSCVRTACPGINVYKNLPAIREAAAALIPSIQDFHLMQILNRR